ncbi:MAG: MFS transporter [Christensenellaceae bacterium]|jgi:fucose permease
MAKNSMRIFIYTAVVCITSFFMCLSNNIVGPLLGDIMQYYSIDLANGGMMTMFQNIGGVLAIILLAIIMDRFNKQVVHIFPLALLTLSLLLIGGAPPLGVFWMSFLLFGIAIGTIDMVSNAIISDTHPNNRNVALSILHCISPIGAIFIPLVAGALTESGTPWQDVYTTVGFMMLIVLVAYLLVFAVSRKQLQPFSMHKTVKRQKGATGKFFKNKNVWLAMLCMFTHVCCQSGIVVWAIEYTKTAFSVDAVSAGWALTLFWLGTSVVRLLFGTTKLKNLTSRPLIVYGGIASGIVLAIGVLSANYVITLACILITACLNAPVLPRIVSILTGWYPSQSGLASSAAFTMLYLAYALSPLIMGGIAAAFGMQVMMLIPAIAASVSGVIGIPLPKEEPQAAA